MRHLWCLGVTIQCQYDYPSQENPQNQGSFTKSSISLSFKNCFSAIPAKKVTKYPLMRCIHVGYATIPIWGSKFGYLQKLTVR